MSMWFIVATLVACVAAQPYVSTEYGDLFGKTITLDDGKQVNSFKGIPFAAPPVGSLRFEPPQKPAPWSGVFNATSLGLPCAQNAAGLVWMTHPGWLLYGEDCLNLNIYTPADMEGGPYPVMVWFHGGGFTGGANIQYPGHFLASYGAVVVVPNYRLGAFGFLATPDHTLTGNAGMLDQVMALQFVQDNIANFGGDKTRVTVFGQSAGGASAAFHMISPLSHHMVHQAICESGAENNFWSANWPAQKPEEYVYQTAAKTDCTRGTDPEIVDCLRTLTWQTIRDNQGLNCTDGYFCQGYAPIMDGPGGFLPDFPDNIRATGDYRHGNMITGICRDDGSLYTLAYIPEADEGEGFTREEFLFYLEDRLLSIWAAQFDQKTYDDLRRAIDFYYSPWPHLEDLWNNREAFNVIATDAAFGMAMDRQAYWHDSAANVYQYIQGYRSLNASTLYAEWMGVPHNGELPYVWGYPRLLHNPDVREDSRIVIDIVGWVDPEDIDYTHYVQEMWTNFARTGNPTGNPVNAPGANEPTVWPRFTEEERFYLDIDEEIQILENYRPRSMAFWREYMSYLSGVDIKEVSPEARSQKGRPVQSDMMDKAIHKLVTDRAKALLGEEEVEKLLELAQNV